MYGSVDGLDMIYKFLLYAFLDVRCVYLCDVSWLTTMLYNVFTRAEAKQGIEETPSKTARWLQTGVEQRMSEAKQDTERMVSEIQGAPQLSGPFDPLGS